MFFKRKAYDLLKEWKASDDGRTALLIEGARRVGKTTLALGFAKNEYRSHILIDFSRASADILGLFEDFSNDLDEFFMRLQLITETSLHERDSVIVFDEVQFCPKARQMIKVLVEDRRYDYIETGSLIQLQQNVRGILIPSEEHSIVMHPMDFEEWLWANGDDVSSGMLKRLFDEKKPLGFHAHEAMMGRFRTYLMVGGMPQAVDRFIETNDIMSVERVKRDIIGLYMKDMMKLPGKSAEKAQALIKGIPSLLSSRKKTFNPGIVMKGARSRSFSGAMDWLIRADIVNPCHLCRDPDVALSLTLDADRTKLYMADTGLLISLAFGNDPARLKDAYEALVSGKLSINQGMVFENSVAQQLAAKGIDLVFHEFRVDDSQLYEIDFLLPGSKGVIPIEVKSSVSTRHRSLDLFLERNGRRTEEAYVIHGKDLRVDGRVTYIPIYMTMLLRRSRT